MILYTRELSLRFIFVTNLRQFRNLHTITHVYTCQSSRDIFRLETKKRIVTTVTSETANVAKLHVANMKKTHVLLSLYIKNTRVRLTNVIDICNPINIQARPNKALILVTIITTIFTVIVVIIVIYV